MREESTVDSQPPPHRVLQPGEDYSLWPNMKWSRARQLASEFHSSVQLFSGSSKSGLNAVVAKDGMSVTFYVRELAPAPIHEWSLLLGDIFHNYRSALDAMAWELTHLDGGEPDKKHLKQIYFPICLTKGDWEKKAAEQLSSIPSDILRRLGAVQPYLAPPPETAIFNLIHLLDIQDKHKAQLRAEMSIRDRSSIQYSFRHKDNQEPDYERGGHGPIEWLAPDGKVQEGDPVFRVTSRIPFVWAESNMPLPLTLYVNLNGEKHDVFQLLDLVDKQIALTFHIINYGQEPPWVHEEMSPGGDRSTSNEAPGVNLV